LAGKLFFSPEKPETVVTPIVLSGTIPFRTLRGVPRPPHTPPRREYVVSRAVSADSGLFRRAPADEAARAVARHLAVRQELVKSDMSAHGAVLSLEPPRSSLLLCGNLET
jgi:hypothetical protein